MLESILQNTHAVVAIMAFLIFLVVELLKQPIKLLTKKLPSGKRRVVNSIILLMPIGLGILSDFLFNYFYTHTGFDIFQGIYVGGESMAIYGFIERFFGLKGKNPYTSVDGQLIVDAATEVVKTKKFNILKIFTLFSKLFSKKDNANTTEAVDGESAGTIENEAVEQQPETQEDILKKILDNIK